MRYPRLVRLVAIVCLGGMVGCSKPATNPSTEGTANSPNGASAQSMETPQTGLEPQGSSSPSGGGYGASGNQSNQQAPATARTVVVPAGTKIEVTADQSVSSKTSNPGDRFEASLSAPVYVHGEQVIPAGAHATGTVTESKSAGKFKGNAELGVALSAIKVHGQEYRVETSSVTEAGKGRGKRTAIGAGGGAALGALIGGLAGHGKGAAIGALAGGGAGTAGAAYTGDRDVTIAAETRLSFRLRSPLEISGR